MVDIMHVFRFLWILPLFLTISCANVREVAADMQDVIGVAPPALDRSSERLISQGACPQVEIVEDLGLVYDFVRGGEKIPQNLISSAKMNGARATCSYGLQSITMDTRVEFVSQMGGSSNGQTAFDYPFFVAVVMNNGAILAKEIFPKRVVPVSYTHLTLPTKA